jgi:hypothetical protein
MSLGYAAAAFAPMLLTWVIATTGIAFLTARIERYVLPAHLQIAASMGWEYWCVVAGGGGAAGGFFALALGAESVAAMAVAASDIMPHAAVVCAALITTVLVAVGRWVLVR